MTLPKGYGPNGRPPPPRYKKKKNPIPELALIIFIISALSALIVANIIVWKPTTITYITSDGSTTFSVFDGNFTFVIDNNISTPYKVMRVYSLDSDEQIIISSSDLIEDTSGKYIDSQNILFNGQPSYPIKNSDINSPDIVSIFMNNTQNQTGLYHGSVFITGEKGTSVPISIDVKPTFERVIIWVINGIAIAVIFWKIIKYYNERYQEDHARYKTLGLREFLKAKKITWGTIGKNAILDLGSILFGMAVGIFGVLNSTYITGVYFLDIYSVIVLLGIGMGIGSLKEYIHRASEPKNPETEMEVTN